MAFTPKNSAVLTAQTVQPTGTIAYWRSNPVQNDPFIDLGYAVLTNRAKTQTTFDVLGNRLGTDVLLKRITKSAAETLTVYSKNNTDEDVLALHSGSAIVKGSAGTGINTVDGLTDTGAPFAGEFLLVARPVDTTALTKIFWFPYAQLTASGEATEDILRYPQFDVTNLAWNANFQANVGTLLSPYITAANGVKITLFVPTAALDNVLTQIQLTGGGTVPAYTPAAGGTTFAPSTAYVLNAKVNPTNTVTYPYQYNVTTAGTSGTTEPVWPTASGSTVTSGTVVFTRI